MFLRDQKFLAKFPNLHSLSLFITCRESQVSPNRSSSGAHVDATFPQLKNLTLDLSFVPEEVWKPWWKLIPWGELDVLIIRSRRSLNPSILSGLTGLPMRLRTLNLGQDIVGIDKKTLNQFLLSFDTLQELYMRRHNCSVSTIANHSKLSKLVVCGYELDGSEHHPVFVSTDLEYLARQCPNLRVFHCHVRGTLAEIFAKVASCFHKLSVLSLHFESGVRKTDWEDADRLAQPLILRSIKRVVVIIQSFSKSLVEYQEIWQGYTPKRILSLSGTKCCCNDVIRGTCEADIATHYFQHY